MFYRTSIFTKGYLYPFTAAIVIGLFGCAPHSTAQIAPVPTPFPVQQTQPTTNTAMPSHRLTQVRTAPPSSVTSSIKLHNILSNVTKRYPQLKIGVAVTDLTDGETASLNGDCSFPMASVFKVPVMLALTRQMQSGACPLTLDSTLTLTNRTKCIGSGDMYQRANGSQVTVRQAIEQMITISDNTATDLLLAQIGTRSVNQMLWNLGLTRSSVYLSNRQAWLLSLRQGVPHSQSVKDFLNYWNGLAMEQKFSLADKVDKQYAGLTPAQLQALEDTSATQETYQQSAAIATAVDNQGSPNDYNKLLSMLWNRQLLDEHWSNYCLGVLGRQQYNSRIPGKLPRGTAVYHKTGTITGVVNDSGIVMVSPRHPVVISVFVNNIPQGQSTIATQAISELSLAVYRHCRAKDDH